LIKKSYIPIIILLLLLLNSASLNIILFSKARHFYIINSTSKLDPLGIDHFSGAKGSYESEGSSFKKIVFFGDSRSSDWTSPSDTEELIFINRGIYGQTTSQVAGRFDNHIVPLQPDTIVLQVGINDLKVIPLIPSLADKIITNCKRNILSIVNQSRHLGASVIITTVFPTGKIPLELRLLWSGNVSDAVIDVNNYIRSLKGPGVEVMDTAIILANEEGLVREEYSRDFLHLNTEGYQALNKELLKLLIEK